MVLNESVFSNKSWSLYFIILLRLEGFRRLTSDSRSLFKFQIKYILTKINNQFNSQNHPVGSFIDQRFKI